MRPVTTLLTLLVTLAPLPVAAQGSQSTRQDEELMNYRLSMDKLRKLVELQRAFNTARAKNPQLFEKIDQESQAKEAKDGAPLTVAQKAAILEQYPEVRSAFSSAGGTARDWLLTFEAMGSAFVAVEAKKGTVTGPPPTTAAQKANVALLEENDAEFRKILEELDGLVDEMTE